MVLMWQMLEWCVRCAPGSSDVRVTGRDTSALVRGASQCQSIIAAKVVEKHSLIEIEIERNP